MGYLRIACVRGQLRAWRAQALASLGTRIWYDESSVKLGDSLSQSIDTGLVRSRFGIVVLSRAFMSKPWPQHELRGLVAREIGGQSRILPIWHEVGSAEMSEFSPTLADKLAVRTSDATAIDIALQILNPDMARLVCAAAARGGCKVCERRGNRRIAGGACHAARTAIGLLVPVLQIAVDRECRSAARSRGKALGRSPRVRVRISGIRRYKVAALSA